MLARFMLAALSMVPGTDAGRPARQDGISGADILADVFDSATESTSAVLRASLVARGVGIIPLLEQVAQRARTAKGKTRVAQVHADLRGEVRRRFLEDPAALLASLRPKMKGLSTSTLWQLGLDAESETVAIVYFNALPYPDPVRLGGLEYLVCAEPPGGKAYEAWGGMQPEEWAAFAKAFEKHSGTLQIRWRDADGVVRRQAMTTLLPWAKPEVNRDGLLLGPNTDESRHPILSLPLAAVQIGVTPAP